MSKSAPAETVTEAPTQRSRLTMPLTNGPPPPGMGCVEPLTTTPAPQVVEPVPPMVHVDTATAGTLLTVAASIVTMGEPARLLNRRFPLKVVSVEPLNWAM